MSQLVLQTPFASRELPVDSPSQDSPTIPTKAQARQIRQYAHSTSPASPVPGATGSGSVTSSLPNSPLSSTGARFRKPAPSPLHNTHAVSPPSSVSPSKSSFKFEFGAHDSPTTATPPTPHDSTTSLIPETRPPREKQTDSLAATKSYYHSDSSGTATPEERTTTYRPALSTRYPNDSRSVSDPIVPKKFIAGLTKESSPAMAGSRMEAVIGAPRNSSIDSTKSSTSTGSSAVKNALDVSSSPADIAKLIKAAGSPEAVIRYLLKEKQSQAQQNSQLWRLVDKQRAMILGLNKDLERALKDKEKYRKKLKEVMASQLIPSMPSSSVSQSSDAGPSSNVTKAETEESKMAGRLDIPLSPSVASDNVNHSPIDVAMAPYPITPPADRCSNGPPSAVGEMLDPLHTMPESYEHALGQFDHDAREREAEEARRQADAAKELPLDLALPPAQLLPRQKPPPQGTPPQPPQHAAEPAVDDDSLAQFPVPPPPPPPPRKAPPAPLQLDARLSGPPRLSPTFLHEDSESDSDDADILEVTEIVQDKRGRRRTRQEDEQEREVLAIQVAEARSLSKKSKKSSSAKGTPKESSPEGQMPASPDTVPTMLSRDNVVTPASLAGILSGDASDVRTSTLMTPGLPATPRPLSSTPLDVRTSTRTSPPLSPRLHGGMPSAPLSPRAPRQPIPLPPHTPLSTPPGEPLALKSPVPLNIVKKASEEEAEVAESPTTSISRESPTERTRVFRGFVTEEFPDLLLPPNALPSVDIRVASSRMKPSRASLISLTQLEEDPVFTLAVFSRSDGGELWRVEKDSISLAKLDQRLKQCAAFTSRTPDRSLFSGHAPAKLDARRVALNQYMDELLNTPLDTATAVELCKYLSTNTLPPNADETGSTVVDTVSENPQTGPGGRPFKNGYLTKRGKNFGGWKARFFVLDGPRLKYYETPGGAHLGTIKLQNSQIGKQSHNNADPTSPVRTNEEADNQYRHAFLILEPKKKDPSALTKHVLCAESDNDRDKWVDALLRWIDYKDDEEDASKTDAARDRQAASAAQPGGQHAKKKMYGQGRNPQIIQGKDSDESLIGVSYEATKQGNLPLQGGAPARSRAIDPPEPSPAHTMSSQPAYTISAPRDPQVISDPSMWSGKMGMGGLAPSGADEKKARKRSFFGFGPKQRSSSDGADSLFGEQSGSSNGSKEIYSGPVRQVFGSPLAEAVRFNSPRDVRVPLPAVVYRCIQYLDAKSAISEEGIFRLSGSNLVIKSLRERFNNESDINLVDDEVYYDIHAVASLLKLYLRELPTTILTRALHIEFLAVTELPNQAEKSAALYDLVERLPQANATLLKYLIAFLIKIINHADQNKMTVRNVGIVFSPTLNIPAPVFAMFLQNYEAIFGIEPEEYSLPSPASIEEQSYELPPRPSTGGGARESPHRQRLAEALQESRRGHTPPPGLNSGGVNPLGGFTHTQMRSTPTPPPGQQTYEPQYLAQQSSNPGVNIRPAYESGFTVPQGYDANSYNPPAQRMANPGYDRPIYETSAGYDQPQGLRANRRESSIWNVTPQGSRSRLREEAPF